MRLVLGEYRDFSCKMSLATKIYLQTLVENTQFSSSELTSKKDSNISFLDIQC